MTRLLIPKERSRRSKLTEEQKIEIAIKYSTGDYSTYDLAEEFGVSRRTIGFAIDPEKYKRHMELVAKNNKERKYYNREKNAQYQKNVKEHRKQLAEQGLLVEPNKND